MDALLEDVPQEAFQTMECPWGSAGRSITLGLVSGFAKLTLTLLNKFEVVNYEQFRQALDHRPKGTGLITIANHVSMFDDPGIPSALTPWARFWLDPWEDRVRWTLCAQEVCFKNEFLRQFFAAGKTLPVVSAAP